MPLEDNILRELRHLNETLDDVASRLARLEARSETEAERCPYREDIARAKNNLARFEKLELADERLRNQVDKLRLDLLKLTALVALSGGMGAAASKIVEALF